LDQFEILINKENEDVLEDDQKEKQNTKEEKWKKDLSARSISAKSQISTHSNADFDMKSQSDLAIEKFGEKLGS
jgi:hypothetical protein